ncbi:hypothetical protein [Anaeromicropila herbilytica]|uniref:Uncharacterized protein n=1 Tax=Anaeromicropila herbilytica TaxID=2785025 RepID=A0A7R7ENR8_9FIRM|nr:hypothetical protein [Anaeromicropila herbilytica]BCN31955.1 hypothetical protein bsdtb5_32500 [Anaeromicropila herbilytica]
MKQTLTNNKIIVNNIYKSNNPKEREKAIRRILKKMMDKAHE